jgi:hypothetical protein
MCYRRCGWIYPCLLDLLVHHKFNKHTGEHILIEEHVHDKQAEDEQIEE